MLIQCRAINLAMTEAIENYIHKKVEPLIKFLAKMGEVPEAWAEVKHNTTHHKKGNVFSAEIHVKLPGNNIRAEAESSDLYAAIDECKDLLKRQILDHKDYLTKKQRVKK